MIRVELDSGASCWALLRKYIMVHGPQNIKVINVNREDCCWRHLYPLSLLFEYVFVCVCVCACVQELLQVVFCAHRSIIQVNVMKVLVPFFRERGMLHAGSYFSTYCRVPRHLVRLSLLCVSSYGCTQLGLVLWQLLHTTQTTKSQHLDFCTFTLLLPTTCFGQLCDNHQGEKMKVETVRSSSPISSMLFMKDFTTFTAPFEIDFRYIF